MKDSIQTGTRTLRNMSIGIVCIALLLATYFTTGNYVSREIRTRDEKISDLNNQVNSLHNLLDEQEPPGEDLVRQIRNLTGVVKLCRPKMRNSLAKYIRNNINSY